MMCCVAVSDQPVRAAGRRRRTDALSSSQLTVSIRDVKQSLNIRSFGFNLELELNFTNSKLDPHNLV